MKKPIPVLILILVVSLGGQAVKYDESFDSATLTEPEPDWPLVINAVVNDSAALKQLLQPGRETANRDGYRVQVLTTKDAEQADALSIKLAAALTDSVYVTFEVPNYKVRVGDYVSRQDAQVMQEKVQQLGYRSAWIVRTRIEP